MNRRSMFGIACLLLVLLVACQVPPTPASPAAPTSGTLLGERTQVFFADDGASGQEIAPNRTATVGDGDEIWTANQGRALLKFVDLWLRIYGDSGLMAEDVTPASVKATLGQGAALVGATPGVYDRIEITIGDPPHALVTLAGTLIMIAHTPDERFTLVRSFDGAATVASSETNERVTVKPGEWAIVWPGDNVEWTHDEDFVRRLALELGLWDRFHEIELDAGSFGPDGAQLPAGQAPQVFVRDREADCPVPEVGFDLTAQRGNQIAIAGDAMGGCPEGGIIRVEVAWGDGAGDELALDGGQAQAFKFSHRYGEPGDYGVVVRAFDTRDRVAASRRVVGIEGAALANLRARIVSAPEAAGCGQALGDDVQIEVDNLGEADAGQFAVGLYLADNPEGLSRTLLLGGREFVDGLPAGASTFVPMTGSNQLPGGLREGGVDYWLIAVADDTSSIQEADEGDNIGTWRIRITCIN